MRKIRFKKYKNGETPETSWQKVATWYDTLVGEKGQYYHSELIIPKSLNLLKLSPKSSLLDVACGQGILERHIATSVKYLGLDISTELISLARNKAKDSKHKFMVHNAEKTFEFIEKFTHATIILALQNIERFDYVLKNISDKLTRNGKFLLVLNHPFFRIPRQTSWEIDEKNKIQFRRINRYLSDLKIPIDHTPGKKIGKQITWSFHRSLERYSEELQKNDFFIEKIEEWTSNKQSQGKNARMENTARTEFPMFMAILCRKVQN